jgi:CheY-like chemotaxis protein
MTKSILIVSDQSEELSLLANRLGTEHYDVSKASNGAEALDYVESKRFDLICIDIQNTSPSSEEILASLKEILTKRTRIILKKDIAPGEKDINICVGIIKKALIS